MLNFYDFIQVFIFTTNHHLKMAKPKFRFSHFQELYDSFPLLFPKLKFYAGTVYSRTSMARTPSGPWKYVQDRGSSS